MKIFVGYLCGKIAANSTGQLYQTCSSSDTLLGYKTKTNDLSPARYAYSQGVRVTHQCSPCRKNTPLFADFYPKNTPISAKTLIFRVPKFPPFFQKSLTIHKEFSLTNLVYSTNPLQGQLNHTLYGHYILHEL